jgi:hypothetical protein
MKPPKVAHTMLKFVIARVGMLTMIVSCCRTIYVTFPNTSTRILYSKASIEWEECVRTYGFGVEDYLVA